MRKRKKKKTLSPVILAFPLILGLALLFYHFFGAVGERVSVLSAGVNMPQGGILILREILYDRIYIPVGQSGIVGNHFFTEDSGDVVDALTGMTTETEQPAVHVPMPPPPIVIDPSSPGGFLPAFASHIPEQYRGTLLSEDFSVLGRGTSAGLVGFGAGWIRNDTGHTNENVSLMLETPLNLNLPTSSGPTVLILHTHATESFERFDTTVYDTRNYWRSRDNNSNVVSVGAVLAQTLENRGIHVIHNTTHHDFPSFNGSYARAAETITSYLERYPSIRIVLDIHRDAIERDNNVIVKPVANVHGMQAAQIMIISAADNGHLGIPNYPQNLRFAAHFQDYMEGRNPGLTRPIFFTYRRYNMHLTPGSLLVEIGSNANTLEEAMYSAVLMGNALADLMEDHM